MRPALPIHPEALKALFLTFQYRKEGKTSMEIVTGETQEKDWIELLFDVVKKNPSFFALSG